MKEIKINEELKNLLPPISDEERTGLEASILKDGCLSPLIMTRTDLSRALHIRPRELDEIIQKLLVEEVIEMGFCEGTGGRPKTVYRMTGKNS